jgi:hypothetical protein
MAEGNGVGGLHRPQIGTGIDGHDRRIGRRFRQRLGLLDPFAGQRIGHAAIGDRMRIAGDVDLALRMTHEPDL